MSGVLFFGILYVFWVLVWFWEDEGGILYVFWVFDDCDVWDGGMLYVFCGFKFFLWFCGILYGILGCFFFFKLICWYGICLIFFVWFLFGIEFLGFGWFKWLYFFFVRGMYILLFGRWWGSVEEDLLVWLLFFFLLLGLFIVE